MPAERIYAGFLSLFTKSFDSDLNLTRSLTSHSLFVHCFLFLSFRSARSNPNGAVLCRFHQIWPGSLRSHAARLARRLHLLPAHVGKFRMVGGARSLARGLPSASHLGWFVRLKDFNDYIVAAEKKHKLKMLKEAEKKTV